MVHKTKELNYYEVPYCACFNSRKLARAITNYYDKKLEGTGINGSQFTLLAAINFYQPVSINSLAEELTMDRTTLSRNADVLEKDKLCLSEAGRKDKRKRELKLTAKGMKKLEKAYPLWEEAQEEFYRFFDSETWKESVQSFDNVIEEL